MRYEKKPSLKQWIETEIDRKVHRCDIFRFARTRKVPGTIPISVTIDTMA